jgi:two-component system, LytTR family, response regulator
MITCIAIDDEPLALQLLCDNISKVPFLKLVAACHDVFEAMKALQNNQIDLMFLDIQMPGLTGLQFLSTLEHKPLAIFITAYKQYALESYELSVVDYLVKPVALDRFIRACHRAKELHELKVLKQQPIATTSADFFFVNIDYSQVKVMFDDIMWMEGLRDYIKIHLKSDKKPLIARINLKAIETQLPAHKFIRIHKSWLVAIAEITAIRKNSLFIRDMELPIGETFREGVERLTHGGI